MEYWVGESNSTDLTRSTAPRPRSGLTLFPLFHYSIIPIFQALIPGQYSRLGQFIGGLNCRSLKAFETTVTDEKAIAPAAKMGLRRMPKKGKSAPAATGMRIVL